jgi:putative tricarboxylic transport membrane protein
MRLRSLAGIAATLLAWCAVDCGAQPAWKPDKNVEIVLGFPAGSAMDLSARVIQKIFQSRRLIDVTSTVINKTGGGGTVAMVYAGQHSGDPHYLSIISSTLLTTHITGGTSYNYTDLTPIALLLDEYTAFSVRADSPIANGAAMVDRLKKDPRALSISIGSALGNSNHIALGAVLRGAGVDIRKLKVVAFNASAEGMVALLGGHIDLVVTSLGVVVPQAQAGKLRILAVTAPQRLSGPVAQVPTWKEQGVNVVSGLWRAALGSKGINAQQVAFWEEVFARLDKTDEWREEARLHLWEPRYLNSRDTRKFLDADYAELRAVLAELGLAK